MSWHESGIADTNTKLWETPEESLQRLRTFRTDRWLRWRGRRAKRARGRIWWNYVAECLGLFVYEPALVWSLLHKMLPRLRSEPPSGKHRESERMPERQKEGKKEYLEEKRREIKQGREREKRKVQKDSVREKRSRDAETGRLFQRSGSQSSIFLVCAKYPLSIATFFEC